jgi:hypothetical protein
MGWKGEATSLTDTSAGLLLTDIVYTNLWGQLLTP